MSVLVSRLVDEVSNIDSSSEMDIKGLVSSKRHLGMRLLGSLCSVPPPEEPNIMLYLRGRMFVERVDMSRAPIIVICGVD